MLRRMGIAAIAFMVMGSFVLAETVRGSITKIDEKEKTIEVSVRARGKKGKAETKTIKYTADTKWTKKKDKDDEGTKVTIDDVKKMIKDAAKGRGVNCTIEHEDEKASSVTFTPGRGGKGGKAKKKKDDDVAR